MDAELLDWLLDSDPVLRWQVERDLAGAPDEVWQATRSRVATEGFGARLLAVQDPDGQWAGGAYFPADASPDEGGQPWTATTWSLNALREWGVDAAVLGDTAARLDAHARWEYDDLPYWGGEVDCCINGYTLANGVWLGADVSGLRRWFGEHQLADGGWNCEWVEGATCSSVSSTLNVITGLLAYETAVEGDEALTSVRHRGEEYLLQRRLIHRRSTGELIAPWVTHFGYPFRWTYSALRAVDHFAAVSRYEGHGPDPRLADAVEVIRNARRPDGRWLQQEHHAGRTWFEVDVPVGQPSKWLTFYGTRALAWWDSSTT